MSSSQLQFGIISPDPVLRDQVRGVLDGPDSRAHLAVEVPSDPVNLSPSEIRALDRAGVHVLFLDISRNPARGVEALEDLTKRLPGRQVVVGGPQVAPELLMRIMRAAPGDYLTLPCPDEEVQDAFERVAARVPASALESMAQRQVGTVIAVFSPRGGAGVSTLATNLAVDIHRRSGKETLLLDLDPGLGTAPLLLGLWPRYSVSDVVRNFHRMDDQLLASFIEKHSSGVQLISSPATPGELDGVPPDEVRMLISVLQGRFEVIVVDLGSTLSHLTGPVLDMCDEAILVATPEVPTLRNIKRVLPLILESSSDLKSRLRVVLNRVDEGDMVGKRDVEDALELPVIFTLSKDDEAVMKAANLGNPAILDGRSPYTEDLMALAVEVYRSDRNEASEAGKKGLFSALGRAFRAPSDKPGKSR